MAISVIAAGIVLIGLIAFLGSGGGAAGGDGADIDSDARLRVERTLAAKDAPNQQSFYVAHTAPGDYEVRFWRYVVRDHYDCDGSVFGNDDGPVGPLSRGAAGNLAPVVYDSNRYQPADETEADLYSGNYLCFAALAGDRWLYGASQIWIGHLEVSGYASDGGLHARIVEYLTNKRAESWKYVVRGDRTCDESVFANNGNVRGNKPVAYEADKSGIYVKESNEFRPQDSDEADDFDSWYFCFSVLLTNGDSEYISKQFVAMPPADDADCPEDQFFNLDTGVCEEWPADDGEPPSDLTLAEMTAARFDDVSSGDEYAEAIGWLYENGITTGCGDGTNFCVDSNVTRAQFVTLLYRLNGNVLGEASDVPPGSEIFEDVKAGSYYDNAVGWAYGAGITTGCRTEEDGSRYFCTGGTLSRAHVATFLHRLHRSNQNNSPPPLGIADVGFEDVDGGAYYATPASWAVYGDVMDYCGDPFFCPGDTVTRAEAADAIYRLVQGGWVDDGR